MEAGSAMQGNTNCIIHLGDTKFLTQTWRVGAQVGEVKTQLLGLVRTEGQAVQIE